MIKAFTKCGFKIYSTVYLKFNADTLNRLFDDYDSVDDIAGGMYSRMQSYTKGSICEHISWL